MIAMNRCPVGLVIADLYLLKQSWWEQNRSNKEFALKSYQKMKWNGLTWLGASRPSTPATCTCQLSADARRPFRYYSYFKRINANNFEGWFGLVSCLLSGRFHVMLKLQKKCFLWSEIHTCWQWNLSVCLCPGNSLAGHVSEDLCQLFTTVRAIYQKKMYTSVSYIIYRSLSRYGLITPCPQHYNHLTKQVIAGLTEMVAFMFSPIAGGFVIDLWKPTKSKFNFYDIRDFVSKYLQVNVSLFTFYRDYNDGVSASALNKKKEEERIFNKIRVPDN